MKNRHGSVAIWVVALLASCTDTEPPPTSVDLGDRAERVLTDPTGDLLVSALDQYVPTEGEQSAAALLWAAAIVSDADGYYHPVLLRWDAEAYFVRMSERYDVLDAGEASGSASEPLISDPPACTDDCSPGFDPVVDRVTQRWQEIQDQAREIVNALGLGRGPAPISDEMAEASVPPSTARAFLDRVARLAVEVGALARLLGEAEIAAEAFAVAGTIGAIRLIGSILRGLRAAVTAYLRCEAWQRENCEEDPPPMDGGIPRPSEAGTPFDSGTTEPMDGGTHLGAITMAGCYESTDGMPYHDVRVEGTASGPIGMRIGLRVLGGPSGLSCAGWASDPPTDGGACCRDETYCERNASSDEVGHWRTTLVRSFDIVHGQEVVIDLLCSAGECEGMILDSETVVCP